MHSTKTRYMKISRASRSPTKNSVGSTLSRTQPLPNPTTTPTPRTATAIAKALQQVQATLEKAFLRLQKLGVAHPQTPDQPTTPNPPKTCTQATAQRPGELEFQSSYTYLLTASISASSETML
ncbi:hypothetical protein AUEXF2481DRAFT_91046 [Aureobasidium subglaciale EXF-2481]|uniref:Uncharacterized protein n=1 Tax=Aureobasidium subglaciale (strain EXF-2481) TaxID=1043005 RepID=A0A074Z0P0_AURSE|nr:uncharacterized protein AUEXF2481DRAFT_91046 [Aureobasidium subglaciale EXF-2481]KEQ92636.1 hypothetical protein AUEXF2481DRAFT_91046 [Aureobasidium subglaciale EXF-2481]